MILAGVLFMLHAFRAPVYAGLPIEEQEGV